MRLLVRCVCSLLPKFSRKLWDNIEKGRKGIGCQGVFWIHVAQVRWQWLDGNGLSVSLKLGKFIGSLRTC
jgi:hypothetical protein